MKQFEEFEKTLDCPATGSLPCSVAENTWRAALEMVQSRFEFGGKVAYSADDILMAVKKEIKEELESK